MPIRVKMPDGKIAQFPDGMSPDQIQAALAKQTPGVGETTQAMGETTQTPEAAPQEATLPQKLVDLLPGAGGLAGGIGGGVLGGTAGSIVPGAGTAAGIAAGGIGGAAVGGAAGEGLKALLGPLVGRELTPAPQLAANLGGAALKEGGLQALGGGLAKGAVLAGRGLMQVAGKVVLPEVAETMIREGVRVTRGGRDRLMRRIGQEGARVEGMVRAATGGGQRFDGIGIGRQIMNEVGPELVDDPTLARVARQRVMRLNRMFLGSQGRLITPERLHRLKQRADRVAKPIYEAIEDGEIVSPIKQIVARWHRALADYARAELDQAVPGYAAQNARTQQLIKVKDAIWPQVSRSQGLVAGLAKAMTRPAIGAAGGATIGAATDPGNRLRGALLGGAAGAAVGNPLVLSSVALGLNNPLLLQALRHAPRGIAAADVLSR